MPQIEVLVKSKESGEKRILTYKSFLDLQEKFDLIGQSDSEGNLIPGDPNLNPRHQRTQASASVVVHAAEGGDQDFTNIQKQWDAASKTTDIHIPEVVEPIEAPEPVLPEIIESQDSTELVIEKGPEPFNPIISTDVPREKRKYTKRKPAWN